MTFAGNGPRPRWHYVDIPGSAKSYKAKRDCPDHDCVVGKIEEFSAILHDGRHRVAARSEALKFLVHFVADVHQPFHAIGDARGGNEIPDVEFGSTRCGFRPCELHGTWNSGLLRHTGVREHRYADQLDAMILQEHLQAYVKPEEWANESLRGAKAAAVRPDANVEAYLQRELPVMNERLAMAGLRLAASLNADLGPAAEGAPCRFRLQDQRWASWSRWNARQRLGSRKGTPGPMK